MCAFVFQEVEKQKKKVEGSVAPEKRLKSKRFKLVEKEFAKRKAKYDDAKLKATKARYEYLLYMDAANSSIQKYFVDDLSDLIDCMDFGFHQASCFVDLLPILQNSTLLLSKMTSVL